MDIIELITQSLQIPRALEVGANESFSKDIIRFKWNHVIWICMARCRLICFLIIVLVLAFLINSFIEFSAVSKLKHSYASVKRRDSISSNLLYTEMRKSFNSDGLATERPPSNESQILAMRCEVIHIGLVCAGYKSNLQLHIMLKSLLFYRNNPVHFHVLVNKFSENVLGTLFTTWDLPQVNVTFYNISEYLSTVRWVPNSHYSGIYGLLKLIFPKVVPASINKLIVLDTDLTFTANIHELWRLFDDFDDLQSVGLTENESDFYLSKKKSIWPAIGKGLNTGVVLYRVDRLRTFLWDKVWTKVTKQAALTYGATSLGDQDVINSVLKQYPHLLYKVPCYWNTQLSDHTHSYNCYKYNQVKVVHWNSPKKFNVVNKDGDYFRSIYNTFLELNGNLVRSQLYDCANTTSHNTQPPPDVCSELKKAKTRKWRTLLYFQNYEHVPVDYDVTFVAQLSYDRLAMVEELCKHWEGPISLTFYVTDPEFQQVNRYVQNTNILQERTNIAYHAVFKDGEFHPINILRNVGLKNVNTPYVFLADIDFLPMFGLYNTLRSTISGLKYMQKKALIVPAFESQRYRSKFPKNKQELLQMLQTKFIFTFRYDVWLPGHAPTDYNKWKSAKEPYTVKWAPDFEPYVVVKKEVVAYDRRFMGFGWNKGSHIMELECQSYEFIVLHNAFIVHQPHSPSYDIRKFRLSPTYRMCLQNLKDEFVDMLKKKYGRAFDNKVASINPPIIK